MQRETFDILAKYIQDNTGICLSEHKQYLLENRLRKVLLSYDIEKIDDLPHAMNANQFIANQIIEEITTNETSFFRDKQFLFEPLEKDVIPSIIKKYSKVNILSLASSSGQEIYSILMMFYENGWEQYIGEMVGFDISEGILQKAQKGIYTYQEVNRGLCSKKISKYFDCLDENTYQISSQIRSHVKFKKKNLLQDLYSVPNHYDIILCRNVLIYFAREDQKKVLDSIHNIMKDDSFAIFGTGENYCLTFKIFEKHSNYSILRKI